MENSIRPLLLLLSRIVLFIIGISVLKALVPFQPTQPIWYLRIGELATDYGVALLFSITLALLACAFQSLRRNSTQEGKLDSRKFIKRFSSIAFAIYLLLIPLQIISYGIYWFQTQQQIKFVPIQGS